MLTAQQCEYYKLTLDLKVVEMVHFVMFITKVKL